MYCANCGKDLALEAKFCAHCGQPRPAPSPPPSEPLVLDEKPEPLTPLQLRRVRKEGLAAHRAGRYDQAARLYAQVLFTTPTDRMVLDAMGRARHEQPLREISGYKALGLTVLLPLLMVAVPYMPEKFFEAWIIIPTILVTGILILYGVLTALYGLFREGGPRNRMAGGFALLMVPAAIAAMMMFDNRRIDERNDRSGKPAAQQGSTSAQPLIDKAARARSDAARVNDDFVGALEAGLPGADAGDHYLQYVVADIYMHGRGAVEADPDKAFAWMSRAAAGGEQGARYNVAWMLETGNGTTAQPQFAFPLYYDLALAGDTAAQNSLGLAYANGTGTAVDPHEAFYWFSRSAEAGCAACMVNLGRAYEYGTGVDVDREQARHWYQQALDRGYAPAREWLTRLD